MEKIDVANLKALVNSEGWKFLSQELSGEIDEMKKTVLSVKKGENNVIKYNEDDLLKRLIIIYTTILSTPEETIESWETETELNKQII